MYLPLILFFISLVGIMIMIGRKLVSTGNAEIIEQDYTHPFVPDLHKAKDMTIIGIKKYGHLSIVEIIRFHVRSTNFLKNVLEDLKEKVHNLSTKKDINGNPLPKAQVSKFLKMISEYKHKIREIRHRIHEEEENNL